MLQLRLSLKETFSYLSDLLCEPQTSFSSRLILRLARVVPPARKNNPRGGDRLMGKESGKQRPFSGTGDSRFRASWSVVYRLALCESIMSHSILLTKQARSVAHCLNSGWRFAPIGFQSPAYTVKKRR